MTSIKTFLTTILCMFFLSTNAQEYHPPLDSRLLLSGTFGELRSNHFHTGIDLKTKGVEGLNIYSIEEGYITRIKVSSYGYGKAIYINHPDGNTSVYAHLKSFSTKIDSIIKKEHYKKESFEINYFPAKDEIKVSKGEIIALSGNSGSSGGAHLHFEIRNTYTEKPLNPLDFNFKILDEIAPIIKKIKFTNLENISPQTHQYFKPIKSGDKYKINDVIKINKKVGVAINTYDLSNDCYNKNGVNFIRMFLDSILVYEIKMDKLDFRTNKYINSHIDFKEKKESKTKYHKCYKSPNNQLNIYKKLVNNGLIKLKDNKIHQLELQVGDSYNNISYLIADIQLDTLKPNDPLTNDSLETKFFSWHTENSFKKNNFSLELPKKSLYQSINFKFQTKDSTNGTYGKIYMCDYDFTPIHKKATISIKYVIKDTLKNKTYIAKVSGKKYIYVGGKWQNNTITTKINSFGDYAIVADSTHPIIRGVNIYPGKVIKNQKTLKCTIEDKESGVKSYKATLNKKWVLLDYDHKTKLIKYDFDQNIIKGKNLFIVFVKDNAGNTKEYKAEFTY
jgi:hypothetical protein